VTRYRKEQPASRLQNDSERGRAALYPPARDLRHSCATLLVAQGVHRRALMEQLGYSKIGTTIDIYAHVMPPMLEEDCQQGGGSLDLNYAPHPRQCPLAVNTYVDGLSPVRITQDGSEWTISNRNEHPCVECSIHSLPPLTPDGSKFSPIQLRARYPAFRFDRF
jgi:hypothetical protein